VGIVECPALPPLADTAALVGGVVNLEHLGHLVNQVIVAHLDLREFLVTAAILAPVVTVATLDRQDLMAFLATVV
jgi:hypothetical protein